MANNQASWFRGWKGEANHLPQSQGQAIMRCQQTYLPLQAGIALFTGRLAGGLTDLRWALNRLTEGPITCESCGNVLTITGDGHKASCELLAQVAEVLTGGADLERRRLAAEAAKLEEKLARNAKKLEGLGA